MRETKKKKKLSNCDVQYCSQSVECCVEYFDVNQLQLLLLILICGAAKFLSCIKMFSGRALFEK